MPKAIDEKFRKDRLKFNLVTNDNLICKDCMFRYDDRDTPSNTSKCDKFAMKPVEVFNNNRCSEYEKQKQ